MLLLVFSSAVSLIVGIVWLVLLGTGTMSDILG
jgi:hypothetical protein